MEEEVTKHTKKIYHLIKDPEHSFWQKLQEVVIEIFIIVFAVTLSIWFHNWSDHHTEQKVTNEFLIGLKGDLLKDIQRLKENKASITQIDSDFNFVINLDENKSIDTINERQIARHLSVSLVITHFNIGRYEGFKSSGKIGTIENDSLKQNILVYYHQEVPDLNDVEELVNSLQSKILDLQLDRADNTTFRAAAKTFKMTSLLRLATSNIDAEIQANVGAQNQATKIISLIDQQRSSEYR